MLALIITLILFVTLIVYLFNKESKLKQIYSEEDMREFREWDVTLMDGLDYDEWDNKHHNEDV